MYAEAFNNHVFIKGVLIVPVEDIVRVSAFSENEVYKVEIAYDSYKSIRNAGKQVFDKLIPICQVMTITAKDPSVTAEILSDIAAAMKEAQDNANKVEYH